MNMKTDAKRIELDCKAAKVMRDIKGNELANLSGGIWKTETAKKRHQRLTSQLGKLDIKLNKYDD